MSLAGPADARSAAHVLVERLDDRLSLDGAAGHHLERVRRVRAGTTLTAADGWGRWRVYDVVASTKGVLSLRATSEVHHEDVLQPELVVAFSLTKGDKPETTVQKLTELGVDRIVVLHAARSIARWTEGGRGMDRLRRVAREACEQCRRARVPVVDGPVSLADAVDGQGAGVGGVVVADRGGSPVEHLALLSTESWLVVVGPEGGFDDSERALLADAPVLGLGPYVLRAETAATAAAAALTVRRTVRARATSPHPEQQGGPCSA